MSGEDESFLSRWSRRKRDPGRAESEEGQDAGTRGNPGADSPPPAPEADHPALPTASREREPSLLEPAPQAGPPPALAPVAESQGGGLRNLLSRWARRQAEAPASAELPPLDLSQLPSIESLTAESDITVFLQRGVPAALRHAALRKAWSLDPAIRDFIGPADYAWDYNAPDGVPGFALDLGGADIRRLLAQAIGQAEEEREEDPAAPDAEPPAELANPSPPMPLAEPRVPQAHAEPDETAPGPVALAGSPMREPLPPPPPEAAAPSPIPADAPPEPVPPPPPRRRHGGALPA